MVLIVFPVKVALYMLEKSMWISLYNVFAIWKYCYSYLIIDVLRDTCTSYSYLISSWNLMHVDVEVIVTHSMDASIVVAMHDIVL